MICVFCRDECETLKHKEAEILRGDVDEDKLSTIRGQGSALLVEASRVIESHAVRNSCD